MPESIVESVSITDRIAAQETLQGLIAASGRTLTNDALNPPVVTLTPTSTPPATRYSAQQITLDGGGAGAIDLTALPGTQTTIDATGLKLQVLRIRGLAANVGAITIGPAVSNPYAPFGTAKSIIYPAGCSRPWKFEFCDKLADVAAGVKAIALSGTAGDKLYVELVLG